MAYSPDLIIINFDMTDVGNDLLYRKFLLVDGRGDPEAIIPPHPDHRNYILTPAGPVFGSPFKKKTVLKSLSHYSNFAGLVHNFVIKYNVLAFQGNFEKYADLSGNWTALEWNTNIEKAVQYSMSILQKTIKFCISHNIKVMVTGVPHRPQFLGEQASKPHEVLRKVTETSGGKFLDSFTEMRNRWDKESLRKFYWSFDGTHFNVEGNKAWADVQITFITDPSNNLLPVY